MYEIRFSVLLVLLSLSLAWPQVAVAASNPNPGVVPPDYHAYGKTLGEWSAAWWQWAAAIPTDVNPLLDETGENCDLDQSGPVWFLAGTPGGAAERECTIPAGKAVLFPILNLLFFNCPDEDVSEAEIRAVLEFLTIELQHDRRRAPRGSRHLPDSVTGVRHDAAGGQSPAGQL